MAGQYKIYSLGIGISGKYSGSALVFALDPNTSGSILIVSIYFRQYKLTRAKPLVSLYVLKYWIILTQNNQVSIVYEKLEIRIMKFRILISIGVRRFFSMSK